MLPGEFTVAQWIVQTLFLGLFVWLLWDTRKDHAARQKRADEREDRLGVLLSDYNTTLTTIVAQIGNLVAQSGNSQEVMIRVVERLDALTQRVVRVDVDVNQMRQWLGDRHATMDTGDLSKALGQRDKER